MTDDDPNETNDPNELPYFVETYTYSPFGEVSIYDSTAQPLVQSAIGNPYMFTAREYDPESGLYYYRLRMYNPQIGRFLQTDPIGYYDSMNLYQYCGNNPTNFIDPWGLRALRRSVRKYSERVSDIYNNPFITIKTSDGNTQTYQVTSRFDLINAINDACRDGNNVQIFTIVGHGVEGTIVLGNDALIGNNRGLTTHGTSEKYKNDLNNAIKNNFDQRASIILRVCSSAVDNPNSVARGFKILLPDATVKGYHGETRSFGTASSIGFNRLKDIE